MRLGRLMLVAGAGLAGYMTYKVIEVATRPIPCEPLRTINMPPDPNAFAEQFAAVVERRMDAMRPRTYREFRADADGP